MTFATATQLEDRYGLGLSTDKATRVLTDATDEIRSIVGQYLTAVEADVVTLPGVWGRSLVLPERPVTAVDSVVLNGTTLTVDTDFTWQRRGVLWRASSTSFDTPGRWWGGPQVEVVVTYDHGFATIPGAVRSACLKLAAAMASQPAGVTQESIDGYSVSFAQSAGVLSDQEMRALNQLRGRSRSVHMSGNPGGF